MREFGDQRFEMRQCSGRRRTSQFAMAVDVGLESSSQEM